MIGGDVVYIRADWLAGLGAEATRITSSRFWRGVSRWSSTRATRRREDADEQPRLAELRSALIAEYPQVGPIFA